MSLVGATYILCSVFAFGGVFSITAGIANWDWFFESMNVRMLTGRMPRAYARGVYIVLGLAIILMALYLFYSIDCHK